MLKKIRKILYASDIKNGSRPAFRSALSLCGFYDAEITYLHVMKIENAEEAALQAVLAKDEIRSIYENSLEIHKKDIQARIDRFFAEEISDLEGLSEDKVTSIVREGKTWRTIVAVANEIDADVIVMGARPHSGLGHTLMGSTTSKVVSHSKRPVLIVPL